MLCLRYVYGSGHACTHSAHTAPQVHIGKGAWGGRVIAGVFEDCCLAYHPHIRLTVLRRAQYYLRQDVSGSCNLPAVMTMSPHISCINQHKMGWTFLYHERHPAALAAPARDLQAKSHA
ncbi:C-C motif chemokine 25 [Pteropus alecto]|uniref:C-C motif chemokine 25 n=1 Tax=Pteropus alecto TaxID=9402 RepID=L5KC52_PTEAL|nr:C-C motif chemokine 25 [Pteropus alecto]